MLAGAASIVWSVQPSSQPKPQAQRALDERQPLNATIRVGEQDFILSGGPLEARAQGFRDCAQSPDEIAAVICYRQPATLFGLQAAQVELALRDADATAAEFNPTALRYRYLRFRFADLDRSLVQVKLALRQNGWLNFPGPGEGSYYHQGVPASITLWRDYANGQLMVVLATESLAVADSRVAAVQARAVEDAAAAARLKRFLTNMRGRDGGDPTSRPPSASGQ